MKEPEIIHFDHKKSISSNDQLNNNNNNNNEMSNNNNNNNKIFYEDGGPSKDDPRKEEKMLTNAKNPWEFGVMRGEAGAPLWRMTCWSARPSLLGESMSLELDTVHSL